jgi:flagellar protein FliS
MYSRQQIASYKTQEILSLPREKLVPVLYEHLIVNLKRAVRQIRDNDIEGKAESLGRASDILHELLSSLDFEVEGGLAPRLASLYAFFIKEVMEVGREMDPERLERLIGLISPLYQSWMEATELVLARDAGAGETPPGGP